MSKVYIVKALNFGDDPDAYENVRAFTSKKLALKFITKFIKQFFNWIDLNNIKFKKHTNVVNFVNFVLNMYYVLSNSPSPICENLSKTLEWLINRIEELNISNYTKDDLVDFNINIDMDSNKDWYIDFL